MKVILKKNLTSKKFNVVFKKGIELNYSSDLKAVEHNEIPNVWLSVTEKQFTIVTKKKYKVQVTRRYYTTVTIEVEAKNSDEAKDLAEDKAGSIEGSLNYEDTDEPYILEGDEDEN